MHQKATGRWLIPLQLMVAAVLAMLVGYSFRLLMHDYMQQDSDAAGFFEDASNGGLDLALDDSLLGENENSMPVTTWSWIYDVARAIGLPADPVWGILLNGALFVVSLLLVVRYARDKFDFGARAQLVLALSMSLNGVLLLFAGIHLRDIFLVFLCVLSVIAFHPADGELTLGGYLRKVPQLLVLMVLSFLCRKESFVVPMLTFCISASFALRTSRLATKVGLGIVVAAVIAAVLSLDVISLIVDNFEAYQLLSTEESDAGSLAYFLIYELPFPVSALASAVLILFIKFPFWRAMFFDSYSFFMSLGALQMLFVAPAFIALAVYGLFNPIRRPFAYLLYVVLAVLLITAITSNQVRHFAIVYPFLFLLCCSRRDIIDARRRERFRLAQYAMCVGAVLLSALVGLRG